MREFRPDVIVGAGIIEAYVSVLLRKPCIIFEDTEQTPSLERSQWKQLASTIITPDCFLKDLGKKQVRFAGYKELAYLHPNYFKPDSSILNELGLSKNEKFVILRFNVFDAVHDIGRHGFTATYQLKLVEELKKHAKVFISPEGILAKELESHLLPIAYDRIHHALYYAQMLVSDTGTMTTEAAILGTPGIMCLSNAGQFGNFIELEQKYDLIYSFREPDQAIQKAVELIQQPDLKEQWAIKRRKLLADKIDVTQFMVDFIENYPESFSKYKR
jgi:predicted glycosyltransferase